MKKYVLEVKFNNGISKFLAYIAFEKKFLWFSTYKKYAIKEMWGQSEWLYWLREFTSYEDSLDATLFETKEMAEKVLDKAIKQNYKFLGIKEQISHEIN